VEVDDDRRALDVDVALEGIARRRLGELAAHGGREDAGRDELHARVVVGGIRVVPRLARAAVGIAPGVEVAVVVVVAGRARHARAVAADLALLARDRALDGAGAGARRGGDEAARRVAAGAALAARRR